MNRVTVSHQTMLDQKAEIESWLIENAGQGTARFGGREGTINHWLNGDDYCYYNVWTVGDGHNLDGIDTVYLFRDGKTATEFALRFA